MATRAKITERNQKTKHIENKRKFIGIELSSEYCDTAEKRINEAIN